VCVFLIINVSASKLHNIRNTEGDFEKTKTIQFSHTPEALLFALNSTPAPVLVEGQEAVVAPIASVYELIIGLRGVGHLVYLDCDSFEQRLVSLNENAWDTHVSFTPLHLSTSPDGKLLLIATDKSLHFIVRIGTSHRVRTLAGHCCGDYGKPSVSWDCTGDYIFCNSDEDSAVFVYSLASERVVDRLSRGHKGIVRGVACHPSKRLVLSASYDKSLVLWDHQLPEKK
jgi:WD40 repeat protein